MPRHGDETKLSEKIGATIREMGELSILTDANVAAADTVAGVKAAISAAIAADTTHGEVAPMEPGFLRAIDTGKDIGDLSDALINPLTTVAGLVALTASANSANRDNFLP